MNFSHSEATVSSICFLGGSCCILRTNVAWRAHGGTGSPQTCLTGTVRPDEYECEWVVSGLKVREWDCPEFAEECVSESVSSDWLWWAGCDVRGRVCVRVRRLEIMREGAGTVWGRQLG